MVTRITFQLVLQLLVLIVLYKLIVAPVNYSLKRLTATLIDIYIYCNCNIIRECYQSFITFSINLSKNLAIREKVMEYMSRMNKEDFPTSRDEVLETLIELETLSNLTLDGTKTSNKLSSVLFSSKEEPKTGPKIINFTKVVIDAKG